MLSECSLIFVVCNVIECCSLPRVLSVELSGVVKLPSSDRRGLFVVLSLIGALSSYIGHLEKLS